MKTYHNMNIIVQTTSAYESYLNGKTKELRHLIISQEILFLTEVTRNNFGALTISIPYGSPVELIIEYVMMFLTYSGMEQEIHRNTSK